MPALHLGEFFPAPVHCRTGNTRSTEKRCTFVATDYDELRTDVKESRENSLEALRSAKAPDAKSVVQELDEADTLSQKEARTTSSWTPRARIKRPAACGPYS
jgi:hypothetical protein